MGRTCCARAAAALLMLAAGAAPANAADGDVVLVLDVSNSMWGRIGDVSKIEIARGVIAGLLQEWNPETGLGLVAYGHRRTRDCGDIELVVPVGPVDPPTFAATVNSLVPRGRTPLTEAVRLAAETLGYRENPATVVLVSDGIETCDADPCALSAELARTGVRFVAHVIGFDVAAPEEQAQLACIAENTGGVYLAAGNAEELSAALADVTETAPPPLVEETGEAVAATDTPAGEMIDTDAVPDALIRLEAIDDTTGAVLGEGVAWTVIALDGERTVLDAEPAAHPALPLPPGDYLAIAAVDGATDQVAFSVEAGVPATHRVHFASLVGTATLSVADTAIPMSRPFEVGWDGPDAVGDHITIVATDGVAGRSWAVAPTADGDPAIVLAPDRPGAYELRYVHGRTRTTLASLPVTILDVPATVSAPDTVVAGSAVEIAWQGPDGPGDIIALVPAGVPADSFGAHAETAAGSPAALQAPDLPGPYEARYVSAQSVIVLASQPVMLLARATLAAPEEAVAGTRITVEWTGPANPDDRIVTAVAGAPEGDYLAHAAATEGSPADLQLPDAPGAYEIRYLTGQEHRTLAAVAITVIPPPVTLDAPDEAVSGSRFEVGWTGPDNDNDRIVVAAAGAPDGQAITQAHTREGAPAMLAAPDEPGPYEVRYMSGQDGLTLASRPLTVVPAPAGIEAPASVVAGARFEVDWTGPDNDNDRLALVEAGAAEGTFLTYAHTRDGNPAVLTAPDAPGAYALRYMTGQDLTTLAAASLTVVSAPASVDGPATVGAGGQFPVEWTGPGNDDDMIVVAAVGAAGGDYDDFAFVVYGSPVTLSAPDEPGDYEIRYLTGQDDRVLATAPLAVTPVTATLQAPASVAAGSSFEVTWTGPANHFEDRIIIVEAGAEPGTYLSDAFAWNGSPATLIAPDAPGAYEVRYMTGRSDVILASVPVEVR